MTSRIVSIPNGCSAELAEYKTTIIPDYKGNPLIEALPDLLTDSEVIEKLSVYPEYKTEERQAESHYRLHMVSRIFQVFQALPMTIQLESKISRTIRQGYVGRNPFSKQMARSFREENENMKFSRHEYENYNYSSSGFALLGVSGLGKTTALHHILNLYPQIIVHRDYFGIPLSSYQLVWLKLECPFDGSVKGLMYEFFFEVDRLLGTNYYEKMIKVRATTDIMLTVMNQVSKNSFIGAIVIDEIQHLTAKSGCSQILLSFLVNLVNNVGVPVILVGTPKAMGILQSEFRQARRSTGIGGDMVCDRLKKDAVFDLLLSSIWRYQWTKTETPITEELRVTLYQESQGIPDLLVKLYAATQAYAISSNEEEITSNLIKKVSRDSFKMVQPMLKAFKSGSVREMAKYDDIYIPNIDFNDVIGKARENVTLSFEAKQKLSTIKQDSKDNICKTRDDITINQNKKRKCNTPENKAGELDTSDVCYIVQEGSKKGKSAYESLKEIGYIKDFGNESFGELL